MNKQARLVLLVLVLIQGCDNQQKNPLNTSSSISQTNTFDELLWKGSKRTCLK